MVVVTKIHLGKRGLGVLSPLENDVVRVLWKNSRGMRVRDVHGVLKKKRGVALTSVAVILDRLHDKKMVTRKVQVGRGGEYYIYSTCEDKDCYQQSVIESTVNKLIDNFGDVAVSYFNERFSRKRKKIGG